MDRGTAKDRRARRRRVLVACTLALLALPGAVGCGGSDADDAAAARRRAAVAARHARELAVGRRVFAENCLACHTLLGQRYNEPVIEFEAPSFDQVRLKRHYVAWRVEYGGPAMASFLDELSDAEFRSIVTYVTESAGREVQDGDPPTDQLAAGRQVFEQICSACHGIAGRPQRGEPVYHGTDFNLVKPSERYVREMVRTGIFAEDGPDAIMPSFRRSLTAEQIDAVAAYVNAVAAEGPEAARTPFE